MMAKSTKRIIVFLAGTFGLMYISHGLIALILARNLIEWDNFPLNILGIIGGGAPAFAALFVVYKMFDEKEKEEYWKKIFLYRVPLFWWAVTILSPLIIGIIAQLIYHGGWWNPDLEMGAIIAFPIMFLAMIFAGGAEEMGWRGILQEKLAGKANLVVIGLIIGVLWGIWHGPLFLIEVFAHYDYSFLMYMLMVVQYSLLLTLVVYKTGSVLLAILLHAGINAFGNLGFSVPMEAHTGVIAFIIGLSVILAAVLCIAERNK